MCRWLCDCGHHNPVWRTACRVCNTRKPKGPWDP